MDNNNIDNQPINTTVPVQPAPADPQVAQPAQQLPAQPVYQQQYPQPGQQVYQQQYQQPAQQVYQQPNPQMQPQYMVQPNPGDLKMSEYDMMSPAEKADRKKKANILCFISLGLHFIPEMISGVFSGVIENISDLSSNGSLSEAMTMVYAILFGGSYIASWVLMIMARVKYKESKFAKVLMWVYIGLLAVAILAVILVIAMCAYILKDCQGF